MTLDQISAAIAPHQLMIMGVHHPAAGETIVLLGPSDPGFWTHIQQSPEWRDGGQDPIDRWSSRVIAEIAGLMGAKPVAPADDPMPPLFSWALAATGLWQSPVGMLVHSGAGLMVSFRGALIFDRHINAETHAKPCDTCHAPCTTACPVGALGPDGYDTAACNAYLHRPEGMDCLQNGCKVRRSCPAGLSYVRDPGHSEYHMRRFRK